MRPLRDEIVKKKIVEQLTWDDLVNSNNVHIEIKDKTVFLTGTVHSYSAKIAAARDTLEVAGGYEIDNRLLVEFNLQITIPTDNEITETVQNILIWNSNINPVNIQVKTNNGIVTLSGTVASSWERLQAENVINSIKGIVDVINNISVKPSSVRSDSDVKKDIERAFERNALIDKSKVNVGVENGVVHLIGIVANELIKNEIYNTAIYTRGVVDIINEITIE